MTARQISFGRFQIAFNHFRGTVAQDFLQHIDIPAIAQKIDGKGVAKTMGISISDPGSLAEPANQTAQPVPAERLVR